MIVTYVQDKNKAICRYSNHHNGTSSADAIKIAIEKGKLKPGDLAMTMHVTKEGNLEIVKTIKHWAIYVLHGQIEAVPDRVGVLLKPTGWRYYRDYMKYGRIKSAFYWVRRKKV